MNGLFTEEDRDKLTSYIRDFDKDNIVNVLRSCLPVFELGKIAFKLEEDFKKYGK